MSEAEKTTKTGGLILPEWLTVSSSPHLKTKESVSRIMWIVNLSLAPAGLWAIYLFGWRAAAMIAVCTIAAVLTEWVVQKIRKVPSTCLDGSAFLTGLLIAYCVPPSLPLWMAAMGTVFAVFVAKHTFGGLGQNVFNPAHIGRAFLLASFPVQMTTWSAVSSASPEAVDAVTTATPLGILKEQGVEALHAHFGSGAELYWKLFSGQINGSIGEVSALLLMIGGIALIAMKYIRWETPVVYVAVVGLLSWAFPAEGSLFSGDPLFHVLSGGLILGAFFMMTDYVTTPITRKGQIIFAFFAALIVWLIRSYGGYPEGVCYSILLMNCFTPLIDRLVKPVRYGVKEGKKA